MPGRFQGIEVIDVRGRGPQRVRLDDAALRRLPQNHSGFAFSVARKLTVLGDAEGTLVFDLTGFGERGGSAGRVVYGKGGPLWAGDLQAQLRLLEEELSRHAPPRERSEWDLDRDDWKELAAKGHVKFMIPCLMPGGDSWKGWPPSQLNELGLSPEDGQIIADAHRRSNERLWAVVRPLGLEAVGSEEVLNALGGPGCVQAINRKARSDDAEAARAARQLVADVRAGLRPEPRDTPQHPVYETLMAVTAEMQRFEADLAESFGPEEANRLAWGPGCKNVMAL